MKLIYISNIISDLPWLWNKSIVQQIQTLTRELKEGEKLSAALLWLLD